MEKAMLNCGLIVCDNDSMSMFVHMLKYFENENHILHNSLCKSNSLIKKYKRRNRILCDKVDNLKRRIQSNKSMESEDKFLFEG